MTLRSADRAGRVLALVAAALLSAASPLTASAQSEADVASARVLFVEGAKLARQGRWQEARALYARSLELKPAPITRYSLGVAQKETGRLADALASFRAFLAEPPTPATEPYVGPAREAVAALEGRVGRVTIAVSPGEVDGLTLVLDGTRLRGAPERALEVDPGAHQVVATAPGFRTETVRFSVDAGRSAEVAVTLAPAPRPQAAAPTPAAGRGLPPVAEAPDDAPSRAFPIFVMGAGGAVFAGGAVLGLSGLKQAADAPARDSADASAARTKGIVGDILGGVGIATVGVGLYLLLNQPADPSPPTSGKVTPWLGASVAGIQMQL